MLERTGEIGLRRALGARGRHITSQFLTESGALGSLGGLIGTSLGVLTVVVASVARNWTPVIHPATVAAAPAIGLLTGLAAGIYPAWRASRIQSRGSTPPLSRAAVRGRLPLPARPRAHRPLWPPPVAMDLKGDPSMDEKVLAAQKWVNATYYKAGITQVGLAPGDGKTGWGTMYAFTRALQHELGITPVSNSFGPTTLAKLAERNDIGPGESNVNIRKIVQHALFCKGYWGGDGEDTYALDTSRSVVDLKSNAGLDSSNGAVQPKVFKALLSMDAYVLLSGGSEKVRDIQRWLNGRYFNKSTFYVGPCDGIYSRDVQTALMKAIQYEIGIPEAQVTGNFGEGTKAGLRNHTVTPGNTGVFVQLFSAACVFNEASPTWWRTRTAT
ncbi:ABC transporter permease [Streptomyces sp. NPDC090741]|uniref:ABC transporter permease n=1 Tax=Streptomyces sp. NPDC090741 TaxID=3365967 RepID=UPI0037F5D944